MASLFAQARLIGWFPSWIGSKVVEMYVCGGRP